MDKIPDRANMIFDLLRKRQRFPYQAADTLSQGVVQALDAAGLSAVLAAAACPELVEGAKKAFAA